MKGKKLIQSRLTRLTRHTQHKIEIKNRSRKERSNKKGSS